jgi:hypothetical protein
MYLVVGIQLNRLQTRNSIFHNLVKRMVKAPKINHTQLECS